MTGWDFFAKYIGVPGILALTTTAAIIAWVSFKIDPPKEAWMLVSAAWTYYFASNGKVIVSDMKAREGG